MSDGKFDVAHQMLCHEDELINQRLTWLFSTQTVLFTGMGLSFALLERQANIGYLLLFAILPVIVIGILVPLVVYMLLKAAIERKKVIDAYWSRHRQNNDPELLRDNKPSAWWCRTPTIPLYFAGSWIFILLFTTASYLVS